MIKNIEIHNFRGIKKAKINDFGRINVFFIMELKGGERLWGDICRAVLKQYTTISNQRFVIIALRLIWGAFAIYAGGISCVNATVAFENGENIVTSFLFSFGEFSNEI